MGGCPRTAGKVPLPRQGIRDATSRGTTRHPLAALSLHYRRGRAFIPGRGGLGSILLVGVMTGLAVGGPLEGLDRALLTGSHLLGGRDEGLGLLPPAPGVALLGLVLPQIDVQLDQLLLLGVGRLAANDLEVDAGLLVVRLLHD